MIAAAPKANNGFHNILTVIQQWEPPVTPHCSNCLHARVSGAPDDPTAYCDKGYGNVGSLWRLIRRQRAVQFRAAVRCPDFVSMSDEP